MHGSDSKTSSDISSKCHLILKKYFGHNSFRDNQLNVILNTIKGNDNLLVMATGSGKSLCYQIPPIYSNKPCIVISPLLSLIKNQIDALKSKGIRAISFSTSFIATKTDYDNAFKHNKYSLIYLTPEGLQSKLNDLISLQKRNGICCIAIDESHCVSEWGHDFRADYRKLDRIRSSLPNVPIIACTATATAMVQKEICQHLQLGTSNHPLIKTISSFNRSNLNYQIKQKTLQLADLNNATFYESGSTVIYCSTRKKCEEISTMLNKNGISSAPYHAGIGTSLRNHIQSEWECNRYQCIVATIAFGMGIDKPDIRCVVHYGMPGSLEAYYQQTGRAGRDGQVSNCILFWSSADFNAVDWRASNSLTQTGKNRTVEAHKTMKKFIFCRECRTKFILNHFGETFNIKCNRCDNCCKESTDELKAKDFTNQARYLVQACNETGQCFGSNVLINICAGNANNSSLKKVWNVTKKKSFGTLSKYSVDWIKSLLRKMTEMDVLKEVWVNKGNNRRFGYRKIMITEMGIKLLSDASFRLEAWIPDSDMMSATKNMIRKTSVYAARANRKRAYSQCSSAAQVTPAKKRRKLTDSVINSINQCSVKYLNQPITPNIKEKWELFQGGKSVDNALWSLCVMVGNGYKINWEKLSISEEEREAVYDIFDDVGICDYNTVRSRHNDGKLSDSEIDVIISSYVMDRVKCRKHGAKWLVEDDDLLWRSRDKCVVDLAKQFGRKNSSVISRISNLRDPTNKNHDRLTTIYGKSIGRSHICCCGSHKVPPNDMELLENKVFSVEEDFCLFENRDCCVKLLRDHFGVKFGVITKRLIDLSGADFITKYRLNEYIKNNHQTKENVANSNNLTKDYSSTHNEVKLPQDFRVKTLQFISNGKGVNLNEIMNHFNISSNQSGEKQKLQRMLQEMCESWEIFTKDNNYLAF